MLECERDPYDFCECVGKDKIRLTRHLETSEELLCMENGINCQSNYTIHRVQVYSLGS